ncbi:MAG: hypothetical protein AAGA81_03950 [Acidobacteriota bacterium]
MNTTISRTPASFTVSGLHRLREEGPAVCSPTWRLRWQERALANAVAVSALVPPGLLVACVLAMAAKVVGL